MQIRGERMRHRRHRRVRGRRRIGIDFHQDFLGRQIDHRESIVVAVARHRVHLDGPLAIGQHERLGAERLELRRLLRLGQPVGVQRPRRGPGLLVVRLIEFVCHDRGAFVHPRAQAARMIEVHVGVDQEPDRLVRNGFLDLRDHRQRPRLALRPLDHDDVIGLIDGDAVMRTAGDIEHAGREPSACATTAGVRSCGRCRA